MEPLGPSDPQQVGGYQLLGRLGAGGMGTVYRARSDRGRTVAVKLVQPELAQQTEFRRRFQQEVAAVRRVGGTFTAPVLDWDTEAETPWVATGYVAGPSLHEVVTSAYGTLPERTLRLLAAGLAHALKDIHSAGLVHRDLKPSNVLVTIDGPRVIDFGIARALEVSRAALTPVGTAVGSPGFMSPEQCRAERVTPASDVFSLGSVLTFAATARSPFGAADSSAHALMLRVVQDEKDLDGVPGSISDLVARCLSQDPAARPSPDDLLAATDAPEGDDGEPWLPSALVATLARRAVELLNTEDPLMTPTPPAVPPPAVAPPVRTPTVPHAAPAAFPSPPPSPVQSAQTRTSPSPPPGGYGYPPVGGYGYPHGAAHTTEGIHQASRRGGKVGLILAAVAVVLAVLAGGIALAVMRGGDDTQADGQGDRSSPDATPGDAGEREKQQEKHREKHQEKGADSDPEPADPTPAGSVPSAFLGAWEGPITNQSGSELGKFQRIEINEGGTGDTVATTWTVEADYLCKEEGELTSATESRLGLTGGAVLETAPEGDCDAYGSQTIEARSDGTLLWTSEYDDSDWQAVLTPATGPGEDGIPYDAVGEWTAENDGSSVAITVEATAAAGALAVTWREGACTWQSRLVSGDVDGDSVLVGPGEVVTGSCDPLTSYRATVGTDDDGSALRFEPFGEDNDSPRFTARPW